jgi:prepilin-type processing-associated H-X9-DG protein
MAMSCWMNPNQVWNSTKFVTVYRKLGSIDSTAERFVFLDEGATIDDGFFVCDPTIPGWINIPASYHNGAGGISFADGHSEIRKWRDGTVLANSPTSGGVGSGKAPTPTTYKDDLNWLQQRTALCPSRAQVERGRAIIRGFGKLSKNFLFRAGNLELKIHREGRTSTKRPKPAVGQEPSGRS